MSALQPSRIANLSAKIRGYGKENLEDILHVLVEAVSLLTQQSRCRVYLEDLSSGALVCAAATGPFGDLIRRKSFPINSAAFAVSRVYITQEELILEDVAASSTPYARELAEKFNIVSSYLTPLIHNGRSLGVLCVDSGRLGQIPELPQRQQLKNFLVEVIALIDQARKHHQQIVLARLVDQAKKREAALYMVKSAVLLIDKLALASVLVPAPAGGRGEPGLRILASYSKEKEAKRLYEDDKLVSLGPGESLLSRYINAAGLITDDLLLSPTYFPDLESEALQKRYLTEELGLKSLYLVPRYEPRTRRIICVVNYYTREKYQFSDFERGLLEAHAEMAQRAIEEIGGQHMEIQVLAEINDLLQERFEGLQPFLNRVLSKATELIGADTGSIALVEQLDDRKWLVVEDAEGRLIGAKSKEWLKKNIPPIRIGAFDLPPGERSLTGYVAATGRPHVVGDTLEEKAAGGFYREITETIRSEIAVPVICEGEVIAVICLDSLKPHHFTDEHRRILLIIERMISRHIADQRRIEKLTTEVYRLRSDVGYKDPKVSSYKLGNIIGNSAKAMEMVEFIQKITPPLANRIAFWSQSSIQEATLGLPSIFITGETGSGKEFLFNNIYSRLNEVYKEKIRPGMELPLKKTNIAAYSGDLTYSELFGHKRGAYTGAHADRQGILEEAHGGVVFLDEIGDADPKTQVQLLRFLDNGGIVRLGENLTRYARVVLVAASNKNLRRLIEQGLFREDLYHRLTELTIEVPSLNERREDIADLAVHFLGQLFRVYKRPEESDADLPSLSRGAREVLVAHHYTGNIRELRSILLRALIFRRGATISAEDIRAVLPGAPPSSAGERAQKLSDALADEIYEELRGGAANFWDALYQPFSSSRLTRETVVAVIERARGEGAGSMPKLALALRACDPKSTDPEEKKTFFRFKNFLYKTIRIS
ncbi:GPMC system transcriptional regulator [Geoalkalibacter sp.]|uniref:GPMC system transcriptional regulator n=1 Tax=Geoalkalibacter sp. TaxID=3041440 RepID=UPI00272E918A|nr:GPMC system transcriptional regulator [Geoalkalibacter sp.]